MKEIGCKKFEKISKCTKNVGTVIQKEMFQELQKIQKSTVIYSNPVGAKCTEKAFCGKYGRLIKLRKYTLGPAPLLAKI